MTGVTAGVVPSVETGSFSERNLAARRNSTRGNQSLESAAGRPQRPTEGGSEPVAALGRTYAGQLFQRLYGQARHAVRVSLRLMRRTVTQVTARDLRRLYVATRHNSMIANDRTATHEKDRAVKNPNHGGLKCILL